MAEDIRQVFTSGAMSGTSVIRSKAWKSSRNGGQTSFQARWTGTPVGTSWTFYGSNNYDPAREVAGGGPTSDPLAVWTALSHIIVPAAALPAGSGSDYLFDNIPTRAKWIYAAYENASGTGVLDAWGGGSD